MVDVKPIAIKIKIVAEIKKQELHFAISWKGIYTNKLSFSLGFLELMVSVGFYSLSIKMVLCCVCKWAYKVSQQLRLTELKTWATIHDWLWCCVLFTKLPFFFLNLSSATNYKDQSHHRSSTFYLYWLVVTRGRGVGF